MPHGTRLTGAGSDGCTVCASPARDLGCGLRNVFYQALWQPRWYGLLRRPERLALATYVARYGNHPLGQWAKLVATRHQGN
jgi:hypothetical protein